MWIDLPTKMSSTFRRRFDELDRHRFSSDSQQTTPLNLEIVDETTKLLVLRVVRRRRPREGSGTQDLADFPFTLRKSAGCEVCVSHEEEVNWPNRTNPDPGGARLLSSQPVSARKLAWLAAQSSKIVLRKLWCPEFNGIYKDGRLIRCEAKGEADEMTLEEQGRALHDVMTGQ
jgi:hypothetical protein